VVLHVDGRSYRRSVEVSPDPRASWTQADYVARHGFDTSLNGELSQIDTALNTLDGIRKQVYALMRPRPLQASATSTIVMAGVPLLGRLDAIEAEMTSNQRNDEDEILYADKVRERILTLQATLAESQQPPFAAHLQQASEIHADVERVLTDYEAFLAHDVPAFDAVLQAAGQKPLKM
ncbi:MAG: hypothetical protein JO347_06665, partial [Candidatus Eremiobacteraeota bacterium]|nr:hypothetical protein [Candidatus Eremiobacteraeota bacterium]